MGNTTNSIAAISVLLTKLTDLLATWLAGRDVRRMKKCIEITEQFILDQDETSYSKNKVFKKFKKEFFEYNN